jgi:release factor glutamine methyltransferase
MLGKVYDIGTQVELNREQSELLKSLQKKLSDGYPLDYIIGHIDILGIRVFVQEGTFIPRPCTEELIAMALIEAEKYETIYDVCAGSGLIGLVIAKHFPNKSVFLIEQSSHAIANIKKALEYNVIENAIIIEGDVFEQNIDYSKSLTICNPPYVPENQIYKSVVFEPKNAIYSGIDGLTFFNKFIKMLSSNLPNQIMFELDPSNIRMANDAISPYYSTKIVKDQDEFPRFLIGTK